MKMQNMKLAGAGAALLAIAVVASGPAFAQARSPNDGGYVNVPGNTKLDGGSSTSAPGASYYGRNPDDGGTGIEPSAAQLKAAKGQTQSGGQFSRESPERPQRERRRIGSVTPAGRACRPSPSLPRGSVLVPRLYRVSQPPRGALNSL